MVSDMVNSEKEVNKIISWIVKEKPSLNFEQVKRMIEEKTKELGGLIDEHVVALMIAKELGINLKGEKPKIAKLKIKDLISGLRNVNLVARVLKIDKEASFFRNNREYRYIRIIIGDDTGTITLVLWNEQTNLVREIKPGDVIKITRGYTKDYRGKIELYVSTDGNIELAAEDDLPTLEYFINKSQIDCIIADIEEIVLKPDFACIRGTDLQGRRIRIVVWDDLEERDLPTGRYYICGVRQHISMQNFVEYYTNSRKLKIMMLDESAHEEESSHAYKPSNIPQEGKDITLRGYFLALNPTKFPRIILGDETEIVSLVLVYEQLLPTFATLKIGTEIMIKGIDIVKGSKGTFFRIGRCSSIKVFEEDIFLEKMDFPKKFIINCAGACSIEGVIVSISFNIRYFIHDNNKLVLPFVSFVVDDGTGEAKVYSSNSRVFEELSRMTIDELRDYHELGIAKNILRYIEEEIKGSDIEIQGYMYKMKNKLPQMIAFNVKRTNF